MRFLRRAGWVSVPVVLVACGDDGTTSAGGTTTGMGGNGGASSTDGGATSTGGSTGANGDGSYTITPPYEPAPETIPNDRVAKGTVLELSLSSSESGIYPADIVTGMPFDRSISVYVPAGYIAGTPAPFMVVQDGIAFYAATMIPTLDNMIAAGTLPKMIAIFVEPGPDDGTPDGERSYEYDSVSGQYLDFVETELLPFVEAQASVTLTADPEGRAAMGGSSGGAAAFTMGWFGPDKYRRILTYSGSFCDLQPNEAYPLAAWTYHESLIAEGEAKPLRVALAASENDLDWNTETDKMRGWLDANERMAAALAAKGYHYRYVYAKEAGHIDQAVLEQTLPETLDWVWQGYPH